MPNDLDRLPCPLPFEGPSAETRNRAGKGWSVCCAPVRAAQGLGGGGQRRWRRGGVEMVTPQAPCTSSTCVYESPPPNAFQLAECSWRSGRWQGIAGVDVKLASARQPISG